MEKPILFNTEMVRTILDGRKTTTRRIINPQPKQPIPLGFVIDSTDNKNIGCFGWGKDKYGGIIDYAKPLYKIGDILYVRETWLKADDRYHYKADATPTSERLRKDYGYKWKPSIHMPKVAARIFLRVTDIRVERLQKITEEGAKAEGATKQLWYQPYGTKSENNQEYVGDLAHHNANYITGFAHIWDRTLKKPYGWLCTFTTDPWVWVIEFERI